ncbi:MAG: hypothetical protein ACJAS3_003320 [Roseivirga sp.]|jgi:hypothetical protein
MKKVNELKKYSFYVLMAMGVILTGCSEDDEAPEPENEEEVITDVKLIFTNDADAADLITARAQDPDGVGVQELELLDEITLGIDKSYTLTIEIENNLESPGEDVTEEIEEEDKEHQFFFSFSADAFTNPAGNGNIDNSSDPMKYNDMDGNGNPLGLSTSWTTGSNNLADGTFTIRLQHQPDVKSATSGASDGDTDFELKFVLNIQ